MPTVPTHKNHWIAYLWPGLPHLWKRGSWAGLAVAVGFTALANTLLLATLVYSEWISGKARLIGLAVLSAVWLLAWWQSRGQRRAFAAKTTEGSEETVSADSRSSQQDQWFREAQQCYLASDWVATEQLLLKLLKQDARDVESRLMLATLWRHQGRRDAALRQLDRLERLEAAERWQHEIAAERKKLNQTEKLNQITDAPPEREETETPQTEIPQTEVEDTNRRQAA